MNKFKAFIVLLMGINSGMQITSNIWEPSSEKIPLSILWGVIAVIYIIQIKEPKEEKENKAVPIDYE